MDFSPITVARFWSKVAVTDKDDDCWLWRGAKTGSGYGCFRVPEVGRPTLSAHRVAFCLGSGHWPEGTLVVRHKCDTPLCVNPFHLETGTHLDNSKDMLDRGRLVRRNQAGAYNGAAKLTAENVDLIRDLIASGVSNVSIGRRFGVHHSTISRIRRGGSWTRSNSEAA